MLVFCFGVWFIFLINEVALEFQVQVSIIICGYGEILQSTLIVEGYKFNSLSFLILVKGKKLCFVV